MKRARLTTFLGLIAMVLGNYFLRKVLEESDQRIYAFLPYFYPAQEKLLFSGAYPWWKLLLPMQEITGSWTATTLVITHLIEMRITPPATWYLFNVLLVIASFGFSWTIFRSRVFSFTFALCMGFGTQLYHTYAVPGGIGLCLLFIYFEALLVCAVKVITGAPRPMMWKALFVVTAVVTALAYEGWLDFLVFAWLAGILLVYVSSIWNRRDWRPGVAFCLVVLTLLGGTYVVIKTQYGYGQSRGMESDVVFNYPTLVPAVEDVISNLVLNLYMTVTNFLPPQLMTSMAFYRLGGDNLVQLQHEYHAPFLYLVPMQSLFFWRYYAGALVVLFCYATFHLFRRLRHHPSAEIVTMAILWVMMATGGPTHAFIKARPMNSMPVLAYHVPVGVMGLSLLISYLLYLAWQRMRYEKALALVACTWAVILYGTLARPAVLGHEAAQVGLGEALYPDPMRNLNRLLGFGPGTTAQGAAIYRLTRYIAPTPEPTHVGQGLDKLPGTIPPLTEWQSGPGVTVTSEKDGIKIVGDASSSTDLLRSPPIPVPQRHRAIVRVDATISAGTLCMGVLDQEERNRIVVPENTRAEYAFDTGDNRHVRIVLANCSADTASNPRATYLIPSISYAILSNAGEATGWVAEQP